MEVLFLGTCACDFSQKLNNEYKNVFDRDVRRSSSVLLDGRVLIDCGPHTLNSLDIAGVDYSNIDCILFTHLHSDHFIAENVAVLASKKEKPLRIYVREDADFPIIKNVTVIKMTAFERVDIGGGYYVVGLPANHDQNFYPQWLYFENKDINMLYALDGGWIINSTYYFLRDKILSFAVLDGTIGDYNGDYRIAEHNSIPMIRLLVESMKTIRAINENSKVYISHLAPSLHKSHEETSSIISEFGVNVAFDGLIVKI